MSTRTILDLESRIIINIIQLMPRDILILIFDLVFIYINNPYAYGSDHFDAPSGSASPHTSNRPPCLTAAMRVLESGKTKTQRS